MVFNFVLGRNIDYRLTKNGFATRQSINPDVREYVVDVLFPPPVTGTKRAEECIAKNSKVSTPFFF